MMAVRKGMSDSVSRRSRYLARMQTKGERARLRKAFLENARPRRRERSLRDRKLGRLEDRREAVGLLLEAGEILARRQRRGLARAVHAEQPARAHDGHRRR